MSWSEIFPVLTEEHVVEYVEGRSKEEVEQFEEWFGFDKILGQASSCNASDVPVEAASDSTENARRHIVSATLFWKHVGSRDPDLPVPDMERLTDARRLGLVRRFSPWESYIQPLITRTEAARKSNPEVEFRIYLASDLEFLAPRLVQLGWVVVLMKSPSIRYCPGGFWRFLALEDDALVTVIDTDRMAEVSNEIGRTRLMDSLGLGLWRVPGYYNSDISRSIRYRPILGGHFGGLGGLPIRLLIETFIWHSQRETLRKSAIIPGIGEIPILFAEWPGYGFDEWFQLATLYPRLVKRGTLTFIPKDSRSLLLPVDMEYVQWANPNSESLYF